MADLSEEYSSLRDEMMRRQERIHTTLTYSVGAALAGLAFALTANEGHLSPALILKVALLIQVLLCLAAWYMADNQRTIYRIGTYLALTYETVSGPPRWLRVSRDYPDWLRELSKGDSRAMAEGEYLPPWWKRWGTGAKNAGWIIIAMSIATYTALILPHVRWGLDVVASLAFISVPVTIGLVWVTLFRFADHRKREEYFLRWYLRDAADARLRKAYEESMEPPGSSVTLPRFDGQ